MRTILKLNRPDSDKEMSFEVKYLSSLSIRQRFEMMFKKNREIVELLEKNGHRRPFEIIKRT